MKVIEVGPARANDTMPVDIIVLAHDERHLRRKVLESQHGMKLAFDLPHAIHLQDRDRLRLDSGEQVEVIATDEDLLEVRGRDAVHLIELAWHIGNRHLAAQVEEQRIVILRDRVIAEMLSGLGAEIVEVTEPFSPQPGAYHHHSHD
ncbi:MAG: urease accessory protein UreE [Pseudomonadota bacterium]